MRSITGRNIAPAAPWSSTAAAGAPATLDEAETASDADGHFSLDVSVREGVAYGTLRASAAGYAPSVAHSVYLDEQPHVITLELVPSGK